MDLVEQTPREPTVPSLFRKTDFGKEAGGGSPRKGAKLYLIAAIVAQVAALLRYVTMARLLGPSELGLAATLILTAGFFDLITDTGSDRFLIQDEDGDAPSVQALVQLVYVGRGAGIALFLILLAWPIARLYHQPQLTVGFMLMGLVQLILGFTHMDMRRSQRLQNFRSEALVMILGEIASLIAIVIASVITRNYTAILWGLFARALVSVVTSHVLAERPYRIAYDRAHGPRLRRFAWPLMVSGTMLFIGAQGDRVLVGNQLGVTELGLYSAIMLLVLYPSAILLRYMHALFVPWVAGLRGDPFELNRVADVLGSQTVVLGAMMAAGFAVVAPVAVPLLYGGRYTQSILLIGLIGILQTTRFVIVWPTTVALALGRSSAVMISNLVRMLAFPGALVGIYISHNLEGLVGGFIVGEVISIAAAILLLNRTLDRRITAGLLRYGRFLGVACLIFGFDLALAHPAVVPLAGLTAAAFGLGFWILRSEMIGITTLLRAVFSQRLRVLLPRGRGSA